MSEANSPSPNPDLPQSLDAEPDWGALSPNLVQPPNSVEQVSSDASASEPWQDWQTVDFPNALSVDAIPLWDDAAPETAPSESESNEAEVPQVADLIHLIQELNQCNTLLLDRVSQLEEALEHSQKALETEVGRAQETVASEAQAIAAAQEHMAQLATQLEFTHQTSQRQQILIETLTEQLESSQERVAQLERECAIAQQRCNEQVQQLMESENTCRDLRTRLQRQQRYTLQFKAALDKCLDVPAPNYEARVDLETSPAMTTGAEPLTPLAAQPFLPRVSRIQPWTSQTQFEMSMDEAAPGYEMTWTMEHRLNRIRQTDADLEPQVPESTTLDAAMLQTASLEATEVVQDFDLETVESPLLDYGPIAPTVASEAALPDEVAVDMSQKLDEQITAAAQQLVELPIEALDSAAIAMPQSDITERPASEEDTLWQDLARLIEVSTDDVMIASKAEDFSEFAAQQSISPAEAEAASAEVEQSAPTPEPVGATAQKQPQLPASKSQPSVPMGQSNWPSPVVYPLRPTRKLRSLAAVDLPTFPK